MNARIDAQYHVGRDVSIAQRKELYEKAPAFMVQAKNVLRTLSAKDIGRIRMLLPRTARR